MTAGSINSWIKRHLATPLREPKLSLLMAALFVGLTIPILVFILVYSYHRNAQAINATLREQVAKTRQESIETTQGMIDGVAGTVRLVAEVVAADPDFFRTDKSREVPF